MMEKPRRLVLVEWADSNSGTGWQPIDDVENCTYLVLVQSVGWIVAECEDTIVLVPHIAGEKNANLRLFACGDITIPKSVIRSIRDLQVVEIDP